MRVGFDCDGVLYDFTDGFRRSIPEKFHHLKANRWNFFHDWGISTQEFLDYSKKGVENKILFWTGDPIENSVDVVNNIRLAGHEVIIITHRGIFGEGESLAREATEHWLSLHGIGYDDLVLTEDKTSVKTDIMIEDKPENYLDLEKAGIESWIVDQPWNLHFEAKRRVPDLLAFEEKVLNR